MVKFALLFAALLCLHAYPAREDYTLQDLEMLVTEGSYEEFFQHALDVRPSERQDAWKTMVSQMAEVFARKVLAPGEVTRSNFLKMEALYQWPSLRNNDVFKVRRKEIGLRYLKGCLKTEPPCWDDLKFFWGADTTDPDTAYRLAEMTLNRQDSPVSTWVFLEVAVKSPLSEFYCKKEFVLESIWGKLEVDYIRLTSKGDFLKKLDETVHRDCIPAVNKMAKERLYAPTKAVQRELAYQILATQGKGTEEISDFFFSVYLLESPSKGDLFNLSWNRLTELARHPVRRERVLSRLKSLDPLPDEIFSSLDLAKKRAVLTHFKSSFPEYLLHYADQCINYYGGTKTFENGNPTMHCQDFMNSELAIPFIGSEKVIEFQKVRKI